MKKIEVKYWISIVLSLICIFTIIDTILTFPHDLYAIFISQFIDTPLGIISFLVSLVIQKRETKKEKRKTYITISGVIVGLITAVLSIVLFQIGIVSR